MQHTLFTLCVSSFLSMPVTTVLCHLVGHLMNIVYLPTLLLTNIYVFLLFKKKKCPYGTFLVVQWLGLWFFHHGPLLDPWLEEQGSHKRPKKSQYSPSHFHSLHFFFLTDARLCANPQTEPETEATGKVQNRWHSYRKDGNSSAVITHSANTNLCPPNVWFCAQGSISDSNIAKSFLIL